MIKKPVSWPKISCAGCGAEVGQTLFSAVAYPGKRFCSNCGFRLMWLNTQIPCPMCGGQVGHMFHSAAFLGQGIRYCVSCGVQMTGLCANAECGMPLTVFNRHCELCGIPNAFFSQPE